MPAIGGWDEFTLERFILERLPQWLPTAIVTSLPSNPREGQEVYYLASAANGWVWHLKYRAGAGTYKWEFMGGMPLYAAVETGQSTASTTYTDLATVGPSLDIPLAGDYLYEWGCLQFSDTALATVFMSPNSSDAAVVQETTPVAGTTVSGARAMPFAGVSVGTKTMKYRTTGGTGTWYYRWFKATPYHVG